MGRASIEKPCTMVVIDAAFARTMPWKCWRSALERSGLQSGRLMRPGSSHALTASASGGGISNQVNVPGHTADLTVRGSRLLDNLALGGTGDTGGTGRGGGIENVAGATLTVSNSTGDHNLAVGGEGGSGGNGLGGGIYEDALSNLTLARATIEHNLAIGGASGAAFYLRICRARAALAVVPAAPDIAVINNGDDR